MSNASKMDVSTVYEMFEEISRRLEKQPGNTVESVQVDMTAVSAAAERLEIVIEEFKKPTKVKHQHTIDIASNWFFFSWIVLVIIIFCLFWGIVNQRQTISQYKENDLKYRHIKMQGQTNEESFYRLERQFKSGDSIKIIRKQVEAYEELVKEQAEKMERIKENKEQNTKIQKEIDRLKHTHK